jgi:hypothetical protein
VAPNQVLLNYRLEIKLTSEVAVPFATTTRD